MSFNPLGSTRVIAKRLGFTPHSSENLRVLGRFRLLRKLGAGSLGEVYLGEADKKRYAIKILPKDVSQDHHAQIRFMREAQLGAKIQHPHLIRCLAFLKDPKTNIRYLVMEYASGGSVQAVLHREKKLPLKRATQIVLDVARGLEELHSRGYVHRDVKPSNILLGRDGTAKLGDLGAAFQLHQSTQLTALGQELGTPAYMPWEQHLNPSLVDRRTDIFALGVSYYRMVTGKLPFPADSSQTMEKIKERGIYTPIRNLEPNTPKCLERIIGKMLARSPEDRYTHAGELIQDLLASGMLSDNPPSSGNSGIRPAHTLLLPALCPVARRNSFLCPFVLGLMAAVSITLLSLLSLFVHL